MNKQEEILNILQEECAEVSQVVSKIRRFGIDEVNYQTNQSQRQTLEMELGDLQCLINLAKEFKIVDADAIDVAVDKKREKLKIWSKIFND